MKINKSFIRIALTVGLVGLAACGGSDSSSRNRNSATVTNVKHYEGVLSLEHRAGSSDEVPTGDQYTVGFDIDLDAVSSTGMQQQMYKGDFRKSITNLSIVGFEGNTGTTDLSKVAWGKCPMQANFYSWAGTSLDLFILSFGEAPNDTVKNADCGQPNQPNGMSNGFYDAEGKYVRTTSDRTFNLRFDLAKGVELAEDSATLDAILPDALDSGFSHVGVHVGNQNNTGYSVNKTKFNLSSVKVKDYQPYELIATPQVATIDLNWKRSADLETSDVLSYDLLWSTDNFETTQSIPLGDVSEHSIPACLINPDNGLSAESKVSMQLVAIDKDGIRSPALEQSVTTSADTVLCPSAIALAAPTGFTVLAEKESVTASWTAVANPDTKSAITYCVSEVNPNLPDSTSDYWNEQNESVTVACSSETTVQISEINYTKSQETKYFVQAQSDAGPVSDRSEIQTISAPKSESVAGLKVVAGDDGLNVKWNPSGYKNFDQVLVIFSVNDKLDCSDEASLINKASENNLGGLVGAAINTENFFISNERLGESYTAGAVVNVCTRRYAWGNPSDWVTANYTKPLATTDTTATDAPATTVAPVVEATAKTAIVTETATEVQLPVAAVEVTVKVEDVYTGFGVTASDVKSIEYQIDAGSWTAVTPGSPLKIAKAASKMAIRVTKTNGEEVVSEKAIVRTEESTDTTVAESDTTMAPADTTAPVTTEAPASSDSSSSNNTLLYILGFIVVAGAAGFFIKKKSASTK